MTDYQTQLTPQPGLFVGHGAPDMLLSEIPAHWVTDDLQMTGPSARYDIEYRASGTEWLNQQLAGALAEAGHPVRTGSRPGLDHGAWVPVDLSMTFVNLNRKGRLWIYGRWLV